MNEPAIHYVASRDGHVAYQVFGDSPITLAATWGVFTNIRLAWDEPVIRRMFERFASFATVVFYDERGTGLSDPLPSDGVITMEERAEDLRAVLDGAGIDRAVIYGQTDGCGVAITFATRHPDRVASLVLGEGYARQARGDGYDIGYTLEELDAFAEWSRHGYDSPAAARAQQAFLNPSLADDPALLDRWVAQLQLQLSPSQAAARVRLFNTTDVRALLPLVRVPTLVLHRRDDQAIPVEHARYLAEHIEGAKLVELPGRDFVPMLGDTEAWMAEIEEFVTGTRAGPTSDRVVTTILFTDIVASTSRAAALGDDRWKQLLDDHDAMVRRQLERFSGSEVKTTGDGFLARFDSSARAIGCAQAIQAGAGQLGLEVRAGVHAGEVELRGQGATADIAGIAVHVAQRVCALAGPGEVLVTGTVKDLVAGAGIGFSDRGAHALKGVPDEWRVLAVDAK